ncbi:hypothetical protein CTEN210_04982 [Chaetoceros tenuissimus]|uniref:LOV domain-containing protein n=1 Tax=Chaetoceros tenuissimus TaxID=426638 RepID=A0AAD3CM65_9STRA|nr:hypothetical protein CTEN210_04982 [Chaetoceros tenuissimus]
MNNQNVQQPIFAPMSQQGRGMFDNDIDLSDIFAEYLNDGGADPLTTFSPYNGMQMQQNTQGMQNTNQGPVMLPTGGIRTSFHTGAMPNMQQPQQQMMQQVQQAQQQMQEHVQKKQRLDDQQQFQHTTQQAAVPSNVSTSGSGITGRLGYNVQGGQITMPTNNNNQMVTGSNVSSAQNGVNLPIGVGIRVGGINTQAGVAQAGGNTLQYGNMPAQQQMTNTSQGMGMWTSGGLSEQAVAERRQRNREHAKRSRVRKKFLLESLQAEVRELQIENDNLRMVVQSKIPQHAQQIINECCKKSPLFEDEKSGESKEDAKKIELVNSDFSLIESLTSGQQNFVLSDPRLPDNPIVYASEGFYQLTGYTREQVLGRNCRFLQGPGTDPKAVDVIRTAVANGTDATTCLLNYKADGTPFWNQFFVAALRDSDNCIVNYVGVQCAIDPEAGANALEDKVNSVLPLANKDDASEKK